jgi:hypothetical protein
MDQESSPLLVVPLGKLNTTLAMEAMEVHMRMRHLAVQREDGPKWVANQ